MKIIKLIVHQYSGIGFIAALIGLLLSLPALAQLSPGDLHQSHITLEGLANCTKCHSAGKQVSPAKCLDCHRLLQLRIAEKKGLHAHAEYKNCFHCHIEHHGRDFALIYWKDGQDNFEHVLSGYPLKGAHAKLACRDCHQPQNIEKKADLLAKKKDLNRTFLGLQQACLSCHADEHRGQLSQQCRDCHAMDAWKPAEKFDHNQAQFRLTGLHRNLECAACHPTERADNSGEKTFVTFRGIAFAKCLDCHRDPHARRFGQNCQKCHNTGGWKKMNANADFNHDKTRFPLQGMHIDVACESCHKPGRSRRGLAFANCTDCHFDFHRGQFTDRELGGACEECHSVAGFSPSSFTIEKHQKTNFQLAGGHLAIPCLACHAGGPQPVRRNRSMLSLNKFTFERTQCVDCHKDPHFGEVKKFVDAGGCVSCHTVESWRKINFDHSQTDFALAGRHAESTCISCHQPIKKVNNTQRISFVNISQQCRDCHDDVHQQQFTKTVMIAGKSKSVTECQRCHTADDWQARRFEHNRDSRFKLDGAHQDVACESCHPTVEKNGEKLTVFKPLETACVTCHGE